MTIAEKIKPYTMQRMKLEPFPWLREYYVDMKKLYTELTLEEIENTITGQISKNLRNYEHMLLQRDFEIQNIASRNKILMKGDPGMGKSTLGKKIGFDWSRGVFNMYSVVFFVALKLVKPGEAIEEVILQQHPELKGLKVSPEKVSAILERFSDRCLLILDGLDEHGLGKNQEVERIIRDEKLLDIGVILSSRPHSVKDIEPYFPLIIRVDGFTDKKAEEFMSNFFAEETKILQIMKFKPSDSRENFPVHKCPILLSFLCFLVKENRIDLLDRNLTIGDLYLQMIQCLYKKFTIRNSMKFENSDFVQIIKSVGILALKTLLSNNPLLQKTEIFKIAGDLAFEYGFFSGHEDFRLCADPTADIYVTYGHRSLEEFFGSLGFLQALDDGKSVDDILGSDCEKPIFMVNPLVFKFCLYLVSCQDLRFTHRNDCYEKLVSYVVKCIDHEQFDPHAIVGVYPAINIMKSVKESNRTELAFFKHILEKCRNVKAFHVRSDHIGQNKFDHIIEQTDWIFNSLNNEVLDTLTLVSVGDYLPGDDCLKSDTLTISISIGHLSGRTLLNIILNKYELNKRNPEVYLRELVRSPLEDYDIATVISKHIKKLHLKTDFGSTLTASCEIPFCPFFTCLNVEGFHIDPSVPSVLTKAVNDGKLANLRCIEIYDLNNYALNWPEVPKFCYRADISTFPQPNQSDVQELLQKLSCLTLKSKIENYNPFLSNFLRKILFTQQITKLSKLRLIDTDKRCFLNLVEGLKQGKLPNLSELSVKGYVSFKDFEPKHATILEKVSLHLSVMSEEEERIASDKLSSCQLRELAIAYKEGIEVSLCLLFKKSFPTLQSLTLQKFPFQKEDMETLACASKQGKLPNLKHLTIDNYRFNTEALHLFTGGEKWNQLLTLRIGDCNVFGIGFECLASLQSLDLRRPGVGNFTIKRCWPHLATIKSDSKALLLEVIKGVEKGLLPALKTVRGSPSVSSSFGFQFHKANITYIRD